MKKLLALVLVLCLASLANAVTISISGSSTIALDGTESYTVSYVTVDGLGGQDVDITADSADKGTLDNVVIVATGRDTAVDWIGPAVGSNSNGWEVSMLNLTNGTGLGGDLFTFDLTATGDLGDIITLSMEGWYFSDDWSEALEGVILEGMDVEIVPEPITLALLGLGGLFIRRK